MPERLLLLRDSPTTNAQFVPRRTQGLNASAGVTVVQAAPFGLTYTISLPESWMADPVQRILPQGWSTEVQKEGTSDLASYRLEGSEEQGYHWLAGRRQVEGGSFDNSLASLARDLRIWTPRVAQDCVFVPGCLLTHEGETKLLFGDALAALGLVELQSSVAIGVDGSVRSYEHPDVARSAQALIWVQEGESLSIKPMAKAALAAKIFQCSLTPFREIGDWLDVVGRLVESVPCFALAIPQNCGQAQIVELLSQTK